MLTKCAENTNLRKLFNASKTLQNIKIIDQN